MTSFSKRLKFGLLKGLPFAIGMSLLKYFIGDSDLKMSLLSGLFIGFLVALFHILFYNKIGGAKEGFK